jgi:alpha-galactosidase
VQVVGLCHSVFWTIDTLAGYLGLPRDEMSCVSAGVNHLAFMLRLEHHGRDLYPELRAFVNAGRVPDDDLVRAELFRRLGYYPTESSEHHAEYNPWFIPKGDLVGRFHIPIGEYLSRARIVGILMNQGSLISNLAADACVEVPCLVDGTGVWPVAVGALPPQCSAYVGPAVDTQALTVHAALNEDRDAVYHAVMQDPQVQARLDLDQVWRLTDELISAEARWLPEWLR